MSRDSKTKNSLAPPEDQGENTGSDFVKRGSELHLSNQGQLELLRALHDSNSALRTMVRGHSMHPLIKDQDVLTIVPAKGHRLSRGDIVAFIQTEREKMAIHRIIAAEKNGWIIRGDNQLQNNGVIPPENILGLVNRIERKGRAVRFGLGPEKRIIARLNRGRALQLIRQAVYLPRWAVALVLHFLQSLSFYRMLGRKLAPPVTVSPATNDEIEAIHQRINPYQPYRSRLENPNTVCLVARRKDKLLGFSRLVYKPGIEGPWSGFWLYSLQVWGLCRGLGYGERLITCTTSTAVEKGATELNLAVNQDNIRAIKLYQKLGFIRITSSNLETVLEAERANTGRQRIIMQKKLR